MPSTLSIPASAPKHSAKLAHVLHELIGEPLSGWEIGVFAGATSRTLLAAFPGLYLRLVDPYDAVDPASNMRFARLVDLDEDDWRVLRRLAESRLEPFRDRVQWIDKPSAKVGAVDGYSTGSADFVFIDADHTYEHVCLDVNKWWPVVRPGGVLCGHDYNSRQEKRGRWGVKRAVDEFAESHGLPVRLESGKLWIIGKPSKIRCFDCRKPTSGHMMKDRIMPWEEPTVIVNGKPLHGVSRWQFASRANCLT